MNLPRLVDLSDRAKLRFTGGDRVRFLNGQVSNDVRRATAANAVYTCVMTIKGKMCGDAFVHAGPDCLLVDAPAELRESLAARLERYIIADDVELTDVTDDYRLFHAIDLPAAPPGAARANRLGREGFDLWQTLGEAAPAGRLLTAQEAEDLRIRAGVPRWGAELDENVMPAEAGLEGRAVDFAKGCYIGQEVVSRIKSVGHVNWALRGLRCAGSALQPGMTLIAAEGADKPLGRVTSVSASLDGPGALALGYVRRGHETPGTVLRVPSGPVEVCALPFAP